MDSHCAGPKRQHHLLKADLKVNEPRERDSASLERIASTGHRYLPA
ncbi:hypothetical protein EMIT013CA1_290006 [Bacillus sp. IT-13CA1]